MQIDEIEERGRKNWINRYYDKDDYNLFENAPIEYGSKIREFFTKNDAEFILDVGCGVGRSSHFISKFANRMIAFDISLAAIKRGAKHLTHINFLVGDMTNIPVKPGIIDGVFCWRVLHNLTARQRVEALSSIDRLLHPKSVGVFAIAANVDQNIEKYSKEGFELKNEKNTYVVNKKDYLRVKYFYSKDAILSEFNPYFRVEEIIRVDEIPGWKAIQKKSRNIYWVVFVIKNN